MDKILKAYSDIAVRQLRSEIGASLCDLILFKLITREVPDLCAGNSPTLHEFCQELSNRNF